ncbi:MAG: hypothetical protein NUK63_08610 [Candidatus Bathyarchaeum tardum]|nr:MAG: hypothetical protein NUK63_08610 [Candidatus Bathyarchaeum tardum]
MSTMDGYRKGWATRYLREAKAELIAAENTPYMAAGFIIEALSKAQASIYYSLGDPTFIVPIIQETITSRQKINEPILNFLIEIEKVIQQIAQNSSPDNEKMMEQAKDIIEFTSEIVELFGGESS